MSKILYFIKFCILEILAVKYKTLNFISKFYFEQ